MRIQINPEAGKVKFQTLHSLTGQSHIDVNDCEARTAITVSALSEEYNQDSVLLTSVYNEEILTNAYYLTVLAQST